MSGTCCISVRDFYLPALDRVPVGHQSPLGDLILDMGPGGGVVLDVNETLFRLDALQPVFDAAGVADQRDAWFSRTLRTGFALTCMGRYRSFPQVARASFKALAPHRISASHQDDLMDAFAQLEPHSDVAAALKELQRAQVRVITLSVGSAVNVHRLFERAGLDGTVESHLSCEAVQRWKPAPEPYLYACEALGADPNRTWMVAGHSWDLGGAAAVGMRTAWVSRVEDEFDSNFGAPDVRGDDLVEVVEQLLE